MAIIEFSFQFLSDVPLVYGFIRADFWFYHFPGFGYYGIFFTSYLLLIAGLISMRHAKSNFFRLAVALFIILTHIIIFLNLFWMFPF